MVMKRVSLQGREGTISKNSLLESFLIVFLRVANSLALAVSLQAPAPQVMRQKSQLSYKTALAAVRTAEKSWSFEF